ncbi:LLM class flavin-dependent oxidoreductase [Duganella sp. FT92W]|uniref:LLM class flavin-dependent oxidoreductase n=1 Tax=Pseudoduganella rivuli TaxID=2666085 RepID=A0A7X2ILE7_9BURK|nr:MupA/Atu3671 family FMN-dependent luciferase-like monooxygenase [Pseudoduganella rivuli]MRV71996.1 LLM class flavin-dependent oxidoreductase [Pseudoduganella rivuli]
MTQVPMQAVVTQLNEDGIYLFVNEGKLKTKALPGALTAAHAELIRRHRDALVAFLSPQEPERVPELASIDKSAGCALSYSQQRLWFLDQFEQGNSAYNIPLALQLTGELDHAAVATALTSILERHESLRTCFRQVEGQVLQFILPPQAVTVPITELDQPDPALRDTALRRLMGEEARRRFVLSEGPMLRAGLIRCSPRHHVLLLTMHHIASDGWSLNLVVQEFSHFYNCATRGHAPELPPLRYQYADYAHWQNAALAGSRVAEAVATYRHRLAAAPALHSLPTDQARPGEMTYNGDFYRRRLPPDASATLRSLAIAQGVSLFALLEAAYAVLLARFSGADDIVIGTPAANRTLRDVEPMIGFFVNTLVLRHRITRGMAFTEVLQQAAAGIADAYSLQEIPFEMMLNEVNPERSTSHHPLFQTFIAFDSRGRSRPSLHGLEVEELEHYHQFAKFDLSLYLQDDDDGLRLGWEYNTDLFRPATIHRLADSFAVLLAAIAAAPGCAVGALPLLSEEQAAQLTDIAGQQALTPLPPHTVVRQIFDQAGAGAGNGALVHGARELCFAELAAKVRSLSAWLGREGIQPGDRVAVHMTRGIDMVLALLAVMARGAAYVPLDPEYPRERLAYIADDADVAAILVDSDAAAGHFPATRRRLLVQHGLSAADAPGEADLSRLEGAAYLIYTSGSTGVPKGVVISHANVANLLLGLDQRLQEPAGTAPVTMLAVTSMSFDISVLELFWTLSRGHRVVLADAQAQHRPPAPADELPRRQSGNGLAFSLYYFASDPERQGHGKYDLLMAGAQFADQNGFDAVWMPERHFHAFGGQFPNPCITAAALSQVTKRLQLRAGSVVLPLHNPIQVAEDWSMVDNLSGGRAGVSVTCGWHFNDFVFAPENYNNRYEHMFEGIEVLRKLWRGEAHQAVAGNGDQVEVRIRPLPLQAQMPIWLTTAGNPETFRRAGRLGLHLLTHILGQTPAQLAANIAIYREARAQAGFAPQTGKVSVMVHTFVCGDMETAHRLAQAPFKEYLRSSAGLLRPFAEAQGWGTDVDPEVLLEAGCQRYFRTNALFGTVEHCARIAHSLYDAGVDEIASLIDFGVDQAQVVEHLRYLGQLRQLMQHRTEQPATPSTLSELIEAHGVNIMQSTPSLMHLMLNEPGAAQAIGRLDRLLLGGEHLSPAVLQALRPHFRGRLHNMYGPTETTVWSGTARLDGLDSYLGHPIANTQFYVLDEAGQLVPPGVIGELYIGGLGVAMGYHGQPALTAERFLPDPYSRQPGRRMYRTGDLVRLRHDGYWDFHGRGDFQVKLNGFRIEPGDIEKALLHEADVTHAVVAVKKDQAGNDRLVAYVMARADAAQSTSMGNERVNSWQALYDETFAAPAASAGADPRFNFASWVSSYDQRAYPRELMQEWIDDTVARIPAPAHADVLEIGVGTGLVLFRLAPRVASYTGIDFAQNGLDYIAAHLGYLGEAAQQVRLRRCAAHEFAAQAGGRYDTAVLNSVVQYFPSEAYLTQVLGDVLANLKPGGSIFVGDVRHLALLEAFATSVEYARARPDDKLIQLRHRISQRVAHERELLLAPAYFANLPTHFPQIKRVQILPKPSHGHTEMSKYRYDVILHTAPALHASRELVLQWQQDLYSGDQVRQLLRTQAPDLCIIDGLPHPLLGNDMDLGACVARRDPQQTVGQLAATRPTPVADASLALLRAVAHDCGYETSLCWHAGGAAASVSLVLRSAAQLASARETAGAADSSAPMSNNPLKEDHSHALLPRLQRNLRQRLPGFMQPDTYILVEQWPYTPNGKIDLQGLPVPEAQVAKPRDYTAPQHELESELALMWAEVLNVERVGIHDNFFDLGGRSLLAAQLLNRIARRWGLELPVRVLFEGPTIAELARHLAQGGPARAVPLLPQGRRRGVPATLLQQSLWFSSLHGHNASLYNMSTSLEINGPLDPSRLSQALAALQQRHDLLNARFYVSDGHLCYDIEDRAPVGLEVRHLAGVGQVRHPNVTSHLRAFGDTPFDLATGPLFRLGLLVLGPDHAVLMFAIHHIISDGWSNRLLIRELFDLYEALATPQAPALPPLPIQYADYALWLDQQYGQDGFKSGLDYWAATLAGMPDLLQLPWDKPRPAVLGAEGGEHLFRLDADVSHLVRQLSSRLGITPYIFMLTAWQLFLSDWSSQYDIAVGTSVQNRSRVELEAVVGYFVNTVVVRQQFDWTHSLEQVLAKARATIVEAFDHQHVPFSLVVQRLNPPRSSSYAPVYQVRFSYEVLGNVELGRGGMAIQPVRADVAAAKFDLALLMNETDCGFEAALGYNRQLFGDTAIAAVCDRFAALIGALVRHAPDAPLASLRHTGAAADNRQERLSRLAARKRTGAIE